MKDLIKGVFYAQRSWGVLFLRLFLSWIFIEAGLKKVFGLLGGSGLDGFAQMLARIGIPYPDFFAVFVGWSELICGILLLLGLLTRFASVIVVIIMAVAIIKVHPNNFNYPGMVLVSALALLNLGGGSLSIDKFLARQ